mmetsp:Transcript_10661/g.20675  ORF Transcript_10661/g.20675 Transcript_10661/m.20675 type:complete len:255 (+) Transcript_10661:128-892(+)
MVRNDLLHPNDRIVVVHVFDNTKTYLAPELRSEFIYRTTESELMPYFKPTQYSLVWVGRDPNKTTRQQLLELAEYNRADVMVVGFHGRRGPKQDPTVMGSAVDFSLQQGSFSLLIVKNQLHRTRVLNGSFNWVVLTDGSAKAEKSFKTAISMMQRERDNLYVIHGRTNPTESLRHSYESHFPTYGVNGVYIDLDIKRSSFIDQLIDFLNSWEVRIDITVVGVHGSTAGSVGAESVGSVTFDVIKYVHSNILVIK